jgi:hypothetical protein
MNSDNEYKFTPMTEDEESKAAYRAIHGWHDGIPPNSKYREVSKSSLRQFTANLETILETMKQAADVFNSLRDISPLCASMLELSLPFQSYAAANYPLGKSVRGFKNWTVKV